VIGKKFLGVAALTLAAANVFALQPTAAELKTAREWVKTAFVSEMKDLPFTFFYDGKKFPARGGVDEDLNGVRFCAQGARRCGRSDVRT